MRFKFALPLRSCPWPMGRTNHKTYANQNNIHFRKIDEFGNFLGDRHRRTCPLAWKSVENVSNDYKKHSPTGSNPSIHSVTARMRVRTVLQYSDRIWDSPLITVKTPYRTNPEWHQGELGGRWRAITRLILRIFIKDLLSPFEQIQSAKLAARKITVATLMTD